MARKRRKKTETGLVKIETGLVKKVMALVSLRELEIEEADFRVIDDEPEMPIRYRNLTGWYRFFRVVAPVLLLATLVAWILKEYFNKPIPWWVFAALLGGASVTWLIKYFLSKRKPREKYRAVNITEAMEQRRASDWKVALVIFGLATLGCFAFAVHLGYTLFAILTYAAWRKYKYWNGIITVGQRSVEWASQKGLDTNQVIAEEVKKFTNRKKFDFLSFDGVALIVLVIWFMFLLVAIFGKGA